MAFRVYPTWVNTLNKTALNTQRWQQEYFIDLSTDMAMDKIKNYCICTDYSTKREMPLDYSRLEGNK
nr:MepB family protein [Leuconostoc fallax]